MPLRLLKYDTATIVDHLKQGHDTFPVVINTVVYHGRVPWNYSTAFVDYYANPRLGAQYLYMAPFTLVNLSEKPAEEVYKDKELGFCFAAFHCTSSSDPYQAFARSLQAPIFQEHFEGLPAAEKNLVLSYLGKCIDKERYSLGELVNLVVTNVEEKEAIMMTIAQAYQEEALQQGVRDRNLEIASNMLLQLHLDIDTVQKATGLTREEVKKLQAATKEGG